MIPASAEASPPHVRSVTDATSRNSRSSGSRVSSTFSLRNSWITSLAPESPRRSWVASPPPRSDSAASRSAAAHPSVEVVSACTSARGNRRPPASFSSAAASSVSKRKAAESISASSSPIRNLPTGKPARDQLVTMSCRW
ncbi:Uncharacterised protein [Mycobacterium tuberculosis]|uniref:Uncharacterized protein n=1 Tax=Mycobacterium tuberculosis TaxID=1773 RepID=A0A655JMC5_MYCTX|nr:Uncharacterised protein [Mycobacterium tuberculosis]CKR01710.1 Uncharacterised protein [Mycobacterium tuberculosis]CKR42947.1 Uncharacterised protein [Mycobacterium tuberculosis]CKS47528.1 Uncharacterised protein [Mycobacterium tuberculosis]CKT00382.1 Uncharacterised protein [Mycobacterium tuberculosis]